MDKKRCYVRSALVQLAIFFGYFLILTLWKYYKMASLPVSAAIRVNITSVRITQKRKRYTKLVLRTWRATRGFPPPTHPRVRRDAGLHLFGYPRRPETASQTFINRQGSEHYDHGAQLARDQTWCAPVRTPLSVPLKVFSRWRESTVCA